MTDHIDVPSRRQRRRTRTHGVTAGLLVLLASASAVAAPQPSQPAAAASVPGDAAHPAPAPAVEKIVVTASRVNLIGRAATASQGSVTEKELRLRPVYRVG